MDALSEESSCLSQQAWTLHNRKSQRQFAAAVPTIYGADNAAASPNNNQPVHCPHPTSIQYK
jgi:hypothetical protein